MSKVFNKQVINADNYVNMSTGETLKSEIPNITSVNKMSSNLTIINSDEYIIIDSKAMEFMKTIFNQTDVARILSMANMVQGTYNVLYTIEKKPHTKETLRTELSYSVNKFRDFINRLYKAGVISYLYSCIEGIEHRFIILNPFIARKSKTFDKECINKFTEYTKAYHQYINKDSK